MYAIIFARIKNRQVYIFARQLICMKRVAYTGDVVQTLQVTDETAKALWHKFLEIHPELKEGKEFMDKSIHLTLDGKLAENDRYTESISYSWGDSEGSGRVFEFADIAYYMFKNFDDFVLTNRHEVKYDYGFLEINVDALTPEDIDEFIIEYLDKHL